MSVYIKIIKIKSQNLRREVSVGLVVPESIDKVMLMSMIMMDPLQN